MRADLYEWVLKPAKRSIKEKQRSHTRIVKKQEESKDHRDCKYKKWTESELIVLIDTKLTDFELSKQMERSLYSIKARKKKLYKELGIVVEPNYIMANNDKQS